MIIDGKQIAQEIIERLKIQKAPKKILAAILVDSTSSPQVGSSLSFLKQKEKVAEELGVDFRIYKFPKSVKNDDLRKETGKIALSKPVGGVIVQLPFPNHLNRHYILNAIPREKDVDVLGERALGAFYTGRNPVLPPAVGVVEEILSGANIRTRTNDANNYLKNKKIAVVGLGFLVGKPIAIWLMGKCAEIYLLDQGSDFSILKQADLVISGVGKAGIIKPEMLRQDAGIIDFGYSMENANSDTRQENGSIKIRGDFDLNSLSKSHVALSFYTPTPGGTGPILTAKIFENFYNLNKSNG